MREAIANGVVTAETLQTYAEAVVVVAERETPARTQVFGRQVAAALAESTVAERHRQAMDERAVTVRPVGDGLALLTALLPEYLAVAVMDRLTQLARTVAKNRSVDDGSGDDLRPADDIDPGQVQQADLERARAVVGELTFDDEDDDGPSVRFTPDEDYPDTDEVPADADYAFVASR